VDRVEVVGCCDADRGRAERAAGVARRSSPGARHYDDLDHLLADARPDAAFNITPAPVHAGVSQACLDAGVHVYTEKPIAGTLADADRLIETARARDLHLLAAPGVAATRRIRWLAAIVASGRLGNLSLAV